MNIKLILNNSQEIPENIKEQILDFYPVYENRLPMEDFVLRVFNLGEDMMGRFLRACHMFQKSQKYFDSDQDVAMLHLVSAVETMKPKKGQILFKDWLVKNRLDDLENKNQLNLKKAINSAYNEWLKVPEREGARHNFVQFLKDNCPDNLKTNLPVRLHDKTEFSFEDFLTIIYGVFRSAYLHKALPSFETPFFREKNPYIQTIEFYLHFYKGTPISVNLTEFFRWFPNVVKESLYNYLISKS